MSESEIPEIVEPLPGAEQPGPTEEPYDLPLGGEVSETPPPSPADPKSVLTTWPDVMGIIAMILGAIGILSKMGTIFYPIFRPFAFHVISRNAPPGTVESFLGFMPDTMVVMISGLIEMALAVLLLVGGYLLKNRRQRGVQFLRIWAWISIPWAVLETGFANIMVRRILPNLPHVGSWDWPVGGFVHVGLYFGLMVSLAVPIFVLAWLGSRSISSETAGWVE
ncbi:hypothetical protein ACFL6R_06185 [Gemmatimonadota bacterium]